MCRCCEMWSDGRDDWERKQVVDLGDHSLHRPQSSEGCGMIRYAMEKTRGERDLGKDLIFWRVFDERLKWKSCVCAESDRKKGEGSGGDRLLRRNR